MMNKLLFHGSPKIVEKPLLYQGKSSNDFGPGFYCSEDRDLAKEWAVSYKRNGYLNKYEINIEDLNVLDLTEEDDGLFKWIALLLLNRPISIDLETKERFIDLYKPNTFFTDIIIGYRGDSSFFSFLDEFLHSEMDQKILKKIIKNQGLEKK